MSAKTAAEKDDPVPDDDFYECVRGRRWRAILKLILPSFLLYSLVGNVDKMEVAIAPLAQRIDAILAR